MANLTFEDLKSFLSFDETTIGMRLDQHAALNQEVCERVLKAYDEVATTELLINELETALRLQVREALKDSKSTEGSVKERVDSDENLQALQRKLKETKLEHTRWSDLRFSYQAMSKNMENKTKLIVSGFLAY